MTDRRIKSIAIVGGGTAGWMTAAVLAQAFGPAMKISLIESDEIGIVGVGEATIPQIHHINNFLGLDENEFIRETQGSFKLGIQFNDWGRVGDSYLHAFGDIGMGVGLLPFHHYWLRARRDGAASGLWDFSLNAQAAIRNRFNRLDRLGSSRLGGVKYAFHFDASLYGRYLRRKAEASGVRRVEDRIVGVAQNPESGFITGLTLQSGDIVTGEFFIDCSGFRGLLIEETLKAGYEDWMRWLPCDRAVAAPCGHGTQFRPYTQATARSAGWQWRIPLQHRVGNGHVYSSAFISDEEAIRTLTENLEGDLLAEPRFIKFTTGRRRAMWVKNCVALGLASGFMEPLESTSIHLVQSGISRLISMFPDIDCDPSLSAEFNRQSQFEFERIRDFLILHYHANERHDSEFWRACRSMAIPDTLQAKIDIFRGTGRVYREGEELFTETGWIQVLLGQRIEPVSYHPLADTLTSAQLDQLMGNLRTLINQGVSTMPTHREFIASTCAAQAVA